MSRDALVVGINSYQYLHPLNAPAADAEAIAQQLEKYGDFRIRRLPEFSDPFDNVRQVAQSQEIFLVQLEDALVQLFKPEGRNVPDTALFFFSGHGLRKARGIQEGYLATSNSNPEQGFYGLSLQWLRRLLQESPVRQQIVWLDCCHSGELLNVNEADPGEQGQGRDRCFIAASREFESAWQDIGSPYSVLTKEILEGLDPAHNPNRWITNYTLVDFLNQRLKGATQRPVFTNFGEPINLTSNWSIEREVVPTQPAATVCPYKGLSYFDCNEEDPQYFYGRELLTDQLLNKVKQDSFLAIVGASGSGKSSVLRAGLLHQLKLGRKLSGSEQWEVHILIPGENPVRSLAESFVPSGLTQLERAEYLSRAEDFLKGGANGLRRLVQVSEAARVVIVVDQFEEIFTLCKDELERQKFIQYLLEAVAMTDNRLCLILAMRADFFNKCLEQEYSGLGKQIQQNMMAITPMTETEMRQAVVEPARKVGLQVESEMVNQILTDIKESPGNLPLLQFTLTEIWKQRDDNCLRLKTYAQLGGIMGTLQKRATEVYERIPRDDQAIVQHVFLSLTQLGEETEDTRRRVLKQDLITSQFNETHVDQVLQQLANEKLIVTSELEAKGEEAYREIVVDVIHEALIRYWPLLRRWLDENRDNLKQQRRIEAEAKEWFENGKLRDYLLRGVRLAQAKDFSELFKGQFSLSTLAREFLKASEANPSEVVIENNVVNASQVSGGITFNEVEVGNSVLNVEALEGGIDFDNTTIQTSSVRASQVSGGITFNEVEVETASFALEALEGGIDFDNTTIHMIGLSVSQMSGGVTFNEAEIETIDFSDRVLEDGTFINTQINQAVFQGSNLNGATFINVNFIQAKISDCTFAGANFIQNSFTKTVLENLYFAGANFTESSSRTNLSGSNLQGANLQGCNLSGSDLNNMNLYEAILSEANLSGTSLRDSNICEANLSRSNLSGTDMTGVKLNHTNLIGIDLRGADVSNAVLQDADLSDADLRGTNLSNTNLRNANLKGVNLNVANLEGADLRGAKNLTLAQVQSAQNWRQAVYDYTFRDELGLEISGEASDTDSSS